MKTSASSDTWHSLTHDQAADQLKTSTETGLSGGEVVHRTKQFGLNQLPEPPKKLWFIEIFKELMEPMIVLLWIVGIVYSILGERRDALVIFVIIISVLIIEMANESRAKKAVKALSKMSTKEAAVIRESVFKKITASELVPGDVVVLHPGDRVPADLRLVETVSLWVNESSLTGESIPARKEAEAVLPPDTELGDQCNLAFSGTLVTSGKGKGIVVATGKSAKLGQIIGLFNANPESRTQLQIKMRQLTQWMVWVAIGASLFVGFLSWAQGTDWKAAILTGLTLVFATVPEELPILITMVLGIGALHLAKKRVIVKKLRTVEALGGLTVVATDKTGTLTENRMRVEKWFVNGQWVTKEQGKRSIWHDRAVRISILANDGMIAGNENGKDTFAGDPTDIAFLYEAERLGYSVKDIQKRFKVIKELPLNDSNRRITVCVQNENQWMVVSKGATEQLLQISSRVIWNNELVSLNDTLRTKIEDHTEQLASEGYRVLGLAYKKVSSGLFREDEAETNLIFVGLSALLDPPRPTVNEAIQSLNAAGVRVLMITGDHAGTAATIGKKVGIHSDQILLGREIDLMSDKELNHILRRATIYARTEPRHKLRIVRALQQQGEIVAVTGDGVNDGPALKEAAIGIAMGQSGTDVAKEAADMVLTDDNFDAVTVAVKEGRKLFANLSKSICYYLAVKVALITSTLITGMLGLTVPFAPIHIIIMELFIDVGAASSFTAERAEAGIMERPPRHLARRFMDKRMVCRIFTHGLSLALAVIIGYLWAVLSGANTAHAQTVAFAVWMTGHLVLALFMRSDRQPLVSLGVFSNRVMLLWIGTAAGFLLSATYLPYIKELLHLSTLYMNDWIAILVSVSISLFWIEIGKLVRWKKRMVFSGVRQ